VRVCARRPCLERVRTVENPTSSAGHRCGPGELALASAGVDARAWTPGRGRQGVDARATGVSLLLVARGAMRPGQEARGTYREGRGVAGEDAPPTRMIMLDCGPALEREGTTRFTW
jgi:hypothetical protein